MTDTAISDPIFGPCWALRSALGDAATIHDIDYQDALMDAWKSWVGDGAHANIDRLRHKHFRPYPSSMENLVSAVVFCNDIEAGLPKHGEAHLYSDKIHEKVRVLAVNALSRYDEVENPHELSEDEFCKEHHAHHKFDLPCYKTKRLAPSGLQ